MPVYYNPPPGFSRNPNLTAQIINLLSVYCADGGAPSGDTEGFASGQRPGVRSRISDYDPKYGQLQEFGTTTQEQENWNQWYTPAKNLRPRSSWIKGWWPGDKTDELTCPGCRIEGQIISR